MTNRKMTFLAISAAIMLTLVSAAVFGQQSPKGSLYRYLSIFTEVFSLVRSNYVDAVPSEQLVDGAFAGVTDAVDEFSYYVPPGQMAQYENYQDDDTNLVGMVMTKRYGYGYVISVLEGSAAEVAGVASGDFVESVNGQPTQKLAIWQIRSAIQSGPGKTLDLGILRGGMSKREVITVTRSKYEAKNPSVRTYGDVAYIKVPWFSEGVAAKFAEEIAKAEAAGREKLIIDLRGNAGGSVEEAIQAADALLSSGLITSLQGRRVDPQRWEADSNVSFEGQVQVLTDSSTALGGEIFAAAIHGNKRGSLTGSSTFGKGVFQKFVPLPSGGGLNVTIGHYTTPDLKPIRTEGIRPDNAVDMSSLALRDPAEPEPDEDLILNKALEIFGQTADLAAAA
ncbi:MAG TPA: S41 family peptidase [Thermoanaerobaculia bacterium]|nr:S41 family peptidase [Thermoanaerobaculia bacterium]